MDLEQSLWSCSGLSQSQRLWEALSGPWWIWVMAMMIWSGWDKNKLPGEVVVGLEQCCWSWSKSWSYGVVWEALTGPGWVLSVGQ